jgi:hypothetical protein
LVELHGLVVELTLIVGLACLIVELTSLIGELIHMVV